MKIEKNHYMLKCLHCGMEYHDSTEGFLLACPENHVPSLLRGQYLKQTFEIVKDLPGIFRFSNWLPIRRGLKGSPGSVTFLSKGLGKRLGLDNLFVIFSGYWPEKGAFMETCTFKELEAPAVCARISEDENNVLVVSSAGNTARAFLQVCSENAIPVVVVVPEAGFSSLWITREKHPRVKIVVLKGDVDYFDAIQVGNMLAEHEGFFPEGGVKNIARRDGLGTALLTAVECMGKMPDHYFQAVGSGTGGVAAWEMSLRLLEGGEFGDTGVKLHLSQNSPFTPMVDSWQRNSPSLLPFDEFEQRRQLQSVRAYVLSNRQPPYSIVGGVYDALVASGGCMYTVSNEEALQAGAIFQKEEGCDIDPAAEVAVASLFQAVDMGRVRKQDVVVLHITGGGYNILDREKTRHTLEPDIIITPGDLKQEERVCEQVQKIIGN
jgi:cysteate synthase